MACVIEISYISFGKMYLVYKLVQRAPTGKDMAPEITDMYLLYCEFEYWERQLPHWRSPSADHQTLLLTLNRFIGDI